MIRSLLTAAAVGLALLAAPTSAAVQATAKIDAAAKGPTISPEIYGQFAEHLGSGIYGGVWVGPDSPIPNTRGYRNDVLAALKALQVPLIRWPGGCFADEYHWREGIGPAAQRRVRVNNNWGGVAETNAFGTHEFMDFAELVGAKTYVNGNLGSGSSQEMADWLEYMTAPGKSTLAEERRRNGRDKPWTVDWFAVGNEAWGCGGNMRPEFYADLYKQSATFLRTFGGGAQARKLAVGPAEDDYNWTEVLMKAAGQSKPGASARPQMDALSLHYYTLPTGDWTKKGSATVFGEAEWAATLQRTLKMEELVRRHSEVMDRYDPEKKVALAVDEWGTWYDPTPGAGELYQQNSLRDALVAAINLNIFQNHADRVRMAAIAQMVNVLQAMILTDGPRMVRTPTYHVFAMYLPFRGATVEPITVSAPEYRVGAQVLPRVHASAARGADGVLHVALVNLDAKEGVSLAADLAGFAGGRVTGQVLTAPAITAINTFDKPDTVAPQPFNAARVSGGRLTADLPARSVVVLAIQPR